MPASGDSALYYRLKLGVGLLSSLLTVLLLAVLILSGASRTLAAWTMAWVGNPSLQILVFGVLIALVVGVITAPLSFLSGFLLEHRFHLSNQSLRQWLVEQMKGVLIAAPLGALVLLAFAWTLSRWGIHWWLPLGIVLTLLSVVLARLGPVLLLPLFYTLSPVEEGAVRDRIVQLCASAGLSVEGVFRFNLSKNTKKVNAGFTGIGKARRVILGDTLLEQFSEEEIATVFAHEVGHYRHHHLAVGMVTGVLSTFIGLFLASRLHDWSLTILGFSSPADLAGLPLLAIWLAVLGAVSSPLGNALSRHHERQADRYAVEATRLPQAFISALRKLAETNLADPDPHPMIEFLFFSHPSITRRIRLIESLPA